MSDTIDSNSGVYEIGCGIYDVTGPAAEVGMMGFADPKQTTQGIYMRLWSRAYIFGDEKSRVVFVCADLCMIYRSVKQGVVEKVQNDPELKNYYREHNILLSATHTHSGPGGYSHHFLYNVTTKGFIPQNFEAIVEGIFQSIKRAHQNLEPGNIFINHGPVENFGINRATRPYERNPPEERAYYASDMEKTMTLLKLVALDGRELGMINWLGVHPTSIGPANRLIGGDHKGYAAYLFEKDHQTDVSKQKTFVASFALSPCADISPNLWGIADGIHDYERMEIIAQKQYDVATELFKSASVPIRGPIDYRHTFVDFSCLKIENPSTTTAPAAMGTSFMSGSTEDNISPVQIFHDGATIDSLTQNERALASLIDTVFAIGWPQTVAPEFIKAQGEKRILIPTGLASWDGFPWTPQILPLQIIRIGSVALAAQPSEISTMAGRRLRTSIMNELEALGVKEVIVSSHSNTYASYVTTREEYSAQEYEGASTHFGPYTLNGFQQEFQKLARAMREKTHVSEGPTPPDMRNSQISFQPGVVFDATPKDKQFGEVLGEPAEKYHRGDLAQAIFQSGHPRNDLMTMKNYCSIEKKTGDQFVEILGDRDPEVLFHWERTHGAESHVKVAWDTKNAEPGIYRIVHHGHAKSFWLRRIKPYTGISREFKII